MILQLIQGILLIILGITIVIIAQKLKHYSGNRPPTVEESQK